MTLNIYTYEDKQSFLGESTVDKADCVFNFLLVLLHLLFLIESVRYLLLEFGAHLDLQVFGESFHIPLFLSIEGDDPIWS